jgi:hypothetical protein
VKKVYLYIHVTIAAKCEKISGKRTEEAKPVQSVSLSGERISVSHSCATITSHAQ